jgi:hypothetical protein
MVYIGLVSPDTRHSLESRAPRLAILEPQREAEWRGCRSKSQEMVV